MRDTDPQSMILIRNNHYAKLQPFPQQCTQNVKKKMVLKYPASGLNIFALNSREGVTRGESTFRNVLRVNVGVFST